MFLTTTLKSTIFTAVAALLLCLSLASTVHAGDQRLAGMWEIVGTPDAGSGVPPFINLSLISANGELTNVDPSEGVGLGTWRRVSNNQYSVTFHGFIPMGPDTVRYTVNGWLSVGPDHNTFTGGFVTEITLMDGTPFFDFAGTISATRL